MRSATNPAVAFLSKVSADGRSLIYSIGLGLQPTALTVSAQGEALVGTYLYRYYQNAYGNSEYLLRVNTAGDSLIYGLFIGLFGGSSHNGISALVLDSQGNCYIGGSATANAPVTPNAFQGSNSNADLSPDLGNGYIVEVNPAGTQVVYGTWFGPGHSTTTIKSLSLGADSSIYFAGGTDATALQTSPSAYSSMTGSGFLARLIPGAMALSSFTYLPSFVAMTLGSGPQQTAYVIPGSEVLELQLPTLGGASSTPAYAYNQQNGFVPLALAPTNPSVWVVGLCGEQDYLYPNCSLGTLITPNAFQSTPSGTGNAVLLQLTNTTIAPSVSQLSFSTSQGTPPPQSVAVTSASSAIPFTVTYSSQSNWLGVVPTSGTATTTGGVIQVYATNLNGLAAGTYTGTITVTPTNGPPIFITATLTVGTSTTGGGTAYTANPNSLSFSVPFGTASEVQTVTLATTAAANSVTLAASATWIQLSTTTLFVSPGVNTSFDVIASPGNLTAGSYNGNITVTPSGSNPSSMQIPVNLTVGTGATSGSGALTTTVASLTFNAAMPTTSVAPQNISINTTLNNDSVTVTPTTQSGSGWLLVNGLTLPSSISFISQPIPGHVSVSVNPAGLTAGQYAGNIAVVSPNSGTVNIPVTLNVGIVSGGGLTLTATPNPLTISIPAGSSVAVAQTLTVTSSVTSTVTAAITGLTWATFNGQPQYFLTAGPGSPGVFTLIVNPAGQNAGTYTGTITVTPAGGTPITVPLTINVGARSMLNVTPQTLSFAYQTGTATPAPQTLAVTSSGNSLGFSVAEQSSGWLIVSPSSGATTASEGLPSYISVQVNPNGLNPGTYSGSVLITASGAMNPNQSIPVTLVVGTSPVLQIGSSGVIFNYQYGSNTQPSPQQVPLTSSSNPIGFTATTAPGSAGSFLKVAPMTGTTPQTLNISVDSTVLAGLTPGTYFTNITLTSPTATNSSVYIPVTLVVGNNTVLTNITFTSVPSGESITIDGTISQTPITVGLTSGTHTVSIAVSSSAPGASYLFSTWNDSVPTANRSITVGTGQPTSYSAGYSSFYELTTAASPSAGGTVSPATGMYYNAGTVVPVIATPVAPYSFTGWSGAVASPASVSTTVTLSAPQTITANFALVPVLAVSKTHSGTVMPGQTGAAYSIVVSNTGGAPTTGTVTVTENPPTALTLVSLSGVGWTCSSNTCTRSDALAPGSSYPAIAATFNIATNATAPLVNTATVSGGGSATASATDTAVINTAPSCNPSVSPSSQNVSAATGTGSLAVNIGPACTWTATSDSWWLNLPNMASNLGPAMLPYSYFANNNTTVRTANVSVGGSPVFSLTQAGSTQPYSTREVTLLYQAFLSREPDSSGLAFWVTQPAQQLGAAFYLSGEFQSVQLNLVQLYRAFYGREPDYTTEYLPGVKALRTGANTVAALAGQLVTTTGITSTAQLISAMCANVNPGAAQAVVASCVSANASLLVLTPNLAALQFIASPSYQGVQSSQRDAVFLMYTITLNRPPDSGGFTYWLNTMTQNNYDDLWIVQAFVISAEFQGRLN